MLNRTKYLIKEHVAMLKLVDTYDIFDAESGEKLGIAKENPGGFMKLLRLVVDKRFLPTTVEIRESEASPPLLRIKRGFTFLRSKVRVVYSGGKELGYFKSKLLTLGGAFDVFDSNDHVVARVKGDWKGWNFKFLTDADEEIGAVTKEWAGIGKELFTSADNYIINLHGQPNETRAALLLAAGLAIDTVYKER